MPRRVSRLPRGPRGNKVGDARRPGRAEAPGSQGRVRRPRVGSRGDTTRVTTMPSTIRRSGLRVTAPESLEVAEVLLTAPELPRTRRFRTPLRDLAAATAGPSG